MRKLFAILMTLCLVFSVVSFAGAEEDVTITFAFWDNNQEPGMQAIADAYHALHPNVNIEVQVTPWDEYWTKLEASALGGAMPDVFWMHSNQFFKYVTADTLLPLDFSMTTLPIRPASPPCTPSTMCTMRFRRTTTPSPWSTTRKSLTTPVSPIRMTPGPGTPCWKPRRS